MKLLSSTCRVNSYEVANDIIEACQTLVSFSSFSKSPSGTTITIKAQNHAAIYPETSSTIRTQRAPKDEPKSKTKTRIYPTAPQHLNNSISLAAQERDYSVRTSDGSPVWSTLEYRAVPSTK
ncbi:hypothetical protein M5K25_016700 [Dendrobium thyrsiflorum]|uniref:Uncharacterized protein n=1 Tax=Dendrobium thyrsiflorum TaxID=117978 RepID=A0ABD0UKV9_DENTH